MNTTHFLEPTQRARDPFVMVRGGTRSAYLDLRVSLTNGETVQFVQTDTAAATRLVEQVRPDRAFTQRHLTIADRNCLTTFPTDGIERLDFLTSPMPDWQPQAASVREMGEGNIARGLECRAILKSGRSAHLDVALRGADHQILPVDFSLFMTRLFSGKCLVGEREGGLFLLNPANIMRVVTPTHAGKSLPGVWEARQVRRRTEQM
jgi:hypothetical protein